MTYTIYKARAACGYSQECIAASIGMSQSVYGRTERGSIKLSFHRAMQMAEAMDMSIYTFIEHITGIPNTVTPPPGYKAIFVPEDSSFTIT